MMSTIFLLLSTLVFLWKADSSMAEIMGTSILERSTDCIKAATVAYDLLQKKGADQATAKSVIEHLEALIEDGKFLLRSAEGFLQKLKFQSNDLDKTMQQLQTEKEELEREKEALTRRKESEERSHSSKNAVFRDNQSQQETAKKEKEDAKNQLQRAERERDDQCDGLFEGLVCDIADLVGHTSGAKRRLEEAERRFDRVQSELNAAQKAASSAKQTVAALQTNIQHYEASIRAKEQQINKKHAEISSVKGSILLLQKSVNFWRGFVVAAENAGERAAALKEVVDQAMEEGDYQLLREDGTVTKTKSFVEAWAMIANDGRMHLL